jgi:very-short-patch-repair endonuclease
MRSEVQRSRTFRHAMSEAEVMLWSRLKLLRERGFHFRRQAPFRGYFLDFVCYARRIVIEVDGGQHTDDRQSEHDFVRDRVLERHGFRVLRFWAGEVQRDLRSVMERIVAVLEAQPSTREGRADPETPRFGPHSPTLAATRPVPPH